MKRCPQCEFIYEDDQSCCDMDGQSLFPDAGLSVMQPTQPSHVRVANRSPLNDVVLPAGVGVLLALAIFLGYTVSPTPLQTKFESAPSETVPLPTDSPSSQQSNVSLQPAGSISAVEPAVPDAADAIKIATPEPTSTPDKAAHAHLQRRNERFPVARNLPPLPRLRPLPRLPEAKPLEKKANANGTRGTQQSPQSKSATTVKKDSKVGSFFKKTGRVLSKPFKL